ncbi:MAG: YggS family pyridoxal phosphate-dependent enzyme [Bacteroidia bacterium]|jgi:pyridoxal phosphate enzyme (YggS family)|nr:YggS family pyridoxal phosphate-dependent enzyme [Bacteroidia bacterium]
MSHSIHENIKLIQSEIGNRELVVVSKYRSLPELQNVYDSGHRHFGENRVQELVEKYTALPKDINWHVIGHLQTNKVKFIAPFVHLIHSVDSLKLLKAINREAAKADRVIPFLFQIHIAQEESKYGLTAAELAFILTTNEYKLLTNVKCKGLMGMATNTQNEQQVAGEFDALKSVYDAHATQNDFDTLSMGMSSDYAIAVSRGSTMIRVGSKIFL